MIHLNGRSSVEGSTDFNFQLSQKRITAIQKYFQDKNFNGNINAENFGEEQHIGNISDYNSNRSVEIILTHAPSDKEKLQNFIADNYPSASEYDYNSSVELKIASDDGTYISIPSSAFVYPDGRPVSGKVKLQVSKIRSINEMLQSNLHSASQHEPLQSAGMFEVKAFKNKNKLKLRKGKEIKLEVSVDTVFNDMTTFQLNDSTNMWYESGENFKLKGVNYFIEYALFFKENLTAQEKVTLKKNISLLTDERRYCLNVLLGTLVKNHEEDKINRLIKLFNINQINMIFRESDYPTNGIALFRNSTQRELKMNDDQFKEINFKKIVSLNTTINLETSSWAVQPENVQMDGVALRFYDIRLSDLTIVNCDRFINQPKLDYVSSNNSQVSDSKSYLIFPSLNCVLPSTQTSDGYAYFNNVPKNKSAIIFSFGIKNGVWYYAKKSITTLNEKEELEWMQCDQETIKREMKNI